MTHPPDRPAKVRRKKVATKPVKKNGKKVMMDASDALVSNELLAESISGPGSSAQRLAAKHGMYTLATTAKLLDRKPITVRRWLRYEECPKPTHYVTYNGHYDMMLFTDDDIALLKEWRDAQKSGRPAHQPTTRRTNRRRPNEPFFRNEVEVKNRYLGVKKTLMPRKETPVEYWARVRGNEIEEFQHETGRNTVTAQRIIHRIEDDPTERRIVKPNAGTKKPKSGEKRQRRVAK